MLTRTEAIQAGLQFYCTGKPCKRGHTAERYVSNRACVECDEARRKRWYLENRERKLACNREWSRNNKERHRELHRKWYERNKEEKNEKSRKWGQDNNERKRELSRKWYRENRSRKMVTMALRRERIKIATPLWLELEGLIEVFSNAPDGFHVDHGVPLQNKFVCGLNVPWNLEVIPANQNLRKHNHFDPAEWSYENGRFIRTILPGAPDYDSSLSSLNNGQPTALQPSQ